MAFKGWPQEAIEFYDGLEEDNSKAYWQAHRATYEASVKQPMEELLAELADEFGPGRLFRPYRDVRFSADKSPYKASLAAALGDCGYIQLSAGGLAAGSGLYTMAADQLQRYRRAVSTDPAGAELVDLVAAVRRAGFDITAHETLKGAPRGYPNDHPRLDLLRQKGLVTWKQWPAAPWLGTSKAKSRVVDFLRRSQPIKEWLDINVGPTTMPSPSRR